jgi:protocatechuate 3,4-dioxygenase beta subunit
VIAPGAGGGPRVRIIDGTDGSTLADFFVYEPTFTGGLYVSVADVNGDGKDDILTGTGNGGGPRVRVLDGATLGQTVLKDFFAYEDTFRGGVLVGSGDINGDGNADVITGTGVGGGPRVIAFDGTSGSVLRNFFAYEDGFRGGVLVGSGDVNGDGTDDILTGTGPGGGPVVRAINGATGTGLAQFLAGPSDFRNGVKVVGDDVNGDGTDELVAYLRSGNAVTVNEYNGTTGAFVFSFTRTVDDSGIATTPTTPSIGVTGFTVGTGTGSTQTANFVVNLSDASLSPVTVQFATADGTAVAGTDYTATSGTLTFDPGVTSLTVPVTITGGTVTSGNKALTLNLSNATNATVSIASATGTITFGSTTTATLTPAVTQGPYFQDYSDVSLNRSDVREGQAGTPLTITFNVYKLSGTTATPLSGARVDIWNANASGVYSDESSEGTAGQTFLRGYQFTDANGSVTFTDIIPGWYPGRTPHLHFMVRSTSASGTLTNLVTSQLFLDQSFINSFYTSTAPYNSRGLPDTTNASDMVYNTTSGGTTAGPTLTVSLSGSAATGYTATFNVYVAG